MRNSLNSDLGMSLRSLSLLWTVCWNRVIGHSPRRMDSVLLRRFSFVSVLMKDISQAETTDDLRHTVLHHHYRTHPAHHITLESTITLPAAIGVVAFAKSRVILLFGRAVGDLGLDDEKAR